MPDIDDLPTLYDLLQHWDGLRAGRPCPMRRDFEPAAVPRLLPHVFIMEHKPGSDTFHYRLIGTFIEARVGRNLAGLTLADFRSGPAHDHIHSLFETCIRDCVPMFGQSRLDGESSNIMQFFRLALPMSSDGDAVDQILGAWDCRHRDQETPDWPSVTPLYLVSEVPVRMQAIAV